MDTWSVRWWCMKLYGLMRSRTKDGDNSSSSFSKVENGQMWINLDPQFHVAALTGLGCAHYLKELGRESTEDKHLRTPSHRVQSAPSANVSSVIEQAPSWKLGCCLAGRSSIHAMRIPQRLSVAPQYVCDSALLRRSVN